MNSTCGTPPTLGRPMLAGACQASGHATVTATRIGDKGCCVHCIARLRYDSLSASDCAPRNEKGAAAPQFIACSGARRMAVTRSEGPGKSSRSASSEEERKKEKHARSIL